MTQREFQKALAIEEGKSIFAKLNTAFPNSCSNAYLCDPGYYGESTDSVLFFHIEKYTKDLTEEFCELLSKLDDYSRCSEMNIEVIFIFNEYVSSYGMEERLVRERGYSKIV